MEYLQQLLDSSEIPVLTAFVLGLLTAVSPCPLATNLTAVGFVSRSFRTSHEERCKVFRNGLLYCLGRCTAYTLLGSALIFIIRKGADTFGLQNTVSMVGEYVLGPVLLVMGVLMLIFEFAHLGGKFGFSGSAWAERLNGAGGALVLGGLFAMSA